MLIKNLKKSPNFQKGGFQDRDFQETELLEFKKRLIKEYTQHGPIWQLQLIAYLSSHLQNE